MDKIDKVFIEKMTQLTSYPEWNDLVEDLKAMIYHLQANSFELPSWEKVQEEKGFAKGLAYIVNYRENLMKVKEATKPDAAI